MALPEAENLKTTPLNARHIAAGGRMVPFSGYSLPVQYPAGIMAEHKWTREHAGLFDVSHMGPSFLSLNTLSGDAEADHAAIAAIIEPLICGDIKGLKPGQVRYTLLLNAEGGAIDDLMVARSPLFPGSLYIVVNAGTKDGDFALIAKAAGNKAKLTRADDGALLALQGPEAVNVIARLAPGAADLGFMTYGAFDWNNGKLIIARSGYTGEDGFEILCSSDMAEKVWDALLEDERIKPIGLGARDSLRLEAGLPLYGHDLDETVSPIEAGLGFAVSKRRREAADFPGADRILAERDGALNRVRVGLIVEGAPAREGAEILDASGAVIGVVTSGGFAPSLGKAIALGFVPPAHSAIGTKLQVSVRSRAQAAEVVQTPFVPHRYIRKAKYLVEGSIMTTKFTPDHEYIRVEGSTGIVGITPYAQEQLGDIVFVELPSVGKVLKKGDEAAVVESVKAASEIYAPVSGTVTEINAALSSEPGLVNQSPETDGWMFKIAISDASELEKLLDADGYAELTL